MIALWTKWAVQLRSTPACPNLSRYIFYETLGILRAILRESEAKLEMKNFNHPSIFCVEVGYLGG